jgi:hypothetical protein
MFFMIDTCQAASLYEKFYSPNILAVASSLVGEDSLSVSCGLCWKTWSCRQKSEPTFFLRRHNSAQLIGLVLLLLIFYFTFDENLLLA